MRKIFVFPATLATVIATLPGAAQATSTTCTTSTVCAEYINTYTSSSPVTGGVAIHGEANGGIGIRGTSVSNVGFYGSSGSGSYLSPGVEGESTNAKFDAAGAFGLAYVTNKTAPKIGALAFGLAYGFLGYAEAPGTSSSTGYGVAGIDEAATSSSGDNNAGVLGRSTFGTGVLAEANGTPMPDFDPGTESGQNYAGGPIGMYSVAEATTKGGNSWAFFGESDGIGLELQNDVNGVTTMANTQNYALASYAYTCCMAETLFTFDYTGDEVLSGSLMTSKGTYVRTAGSTGTAMREYGARSTMPNVEDFGEAQLSSGRAFVRIDAKFGEAIDRHTSYLVFVTPEGDCKGLYVTQKSPDGFAVRELQGGRSSLAFEYRIVAKPVDENGARLATMPAETAPKDVAFAHRVSPQRVPPPLSIEDDLKRRLGPQGYARALAALRARLAGR